MKYSYSDWGWVAPELAQAGKLFRLIVYRKHGWRINYDYYHFYFPISLWEHSDLAIAGEWKTK